MDRLTQAFYEKFFLRMSQWSWRSWACWIGFYI